MDARGKMVDYYCIKSYDIDAFHENMRESLKNGWTVYSDLQIIKFDDGYTYFIQPIAIFENK